MKKQNKPTQSIQFGKQLAALAFVAAVTAFWQLAEAIHIFKNPGDPLSCNLNPIMDCGAVINHEYASIFGPPNMLIGIVFFAFMMSFGVSLALGMKPTRKAIQLQAALSLGMLLFGGWFFYASLYSIGKVCIFCIGIWSMLVPIFFLSLRFLFEQKGGQSIPKDVQRFFVQNASRLIASTYVIMLMLYFARYREYYFG